MPEFRFRLPEDWKLSSYHAGSIFVVGLDGIPWPCKVQVDADSPDETILKVIRNQEESGKLFFIYPVQRRGEMLISTGTLPVRSKPYDLLTELARGTLNRLRNQVSIWQEGGLEIPDQVHELVAQSIHFLGMAIMTDDSRRQDQLAAESIEGTIESIFALSNAFSDQITRIRTEHAGAGQFWLANAAGRGDQFAPSLQHPAFDLVQICANSDCLDGDHPSVDRVGKRTILGPWLDASVGGMPQDWIRLDDYLARRDRILADCRKQLEQLPDSASLIHLVSGLNGIGHRHLSHPQQLQISIDLLRLVDESLIELPVMVSFDFPWAERLASSVGGVHPLQIADSLLRQGMRISFLGLDINLDYWPNGSAIRDPLQWIDLVDVWTQLDLSLILCIRVPGNGPRDFREKNVDRTINHQRSNVTQEQRIEFLETVLPMMIARPAVHGIIWRQWQDGDDPRFPGGGIFDEHGNEKAIGGVITKLRKIIDA